MKNSKFIIAGILLSIFLGAGIALAQDNILKLQQEEFKKQFEDSKFLGCFDGWRQFVSATIGYQSFTGYWKELIEFNICYRTDLEAVRQQVDKARRQVRSTFLRCDTKNLDRLTKNYYKLEAELYFLQHMLQKSETDKPNEQGPVLNRITDPAALRGLADEMKNFFVLEKGFLTDQILQQYIDEFSIKYRPRVKFYNECRGNYYEELGAKWDELVASFNDFSDSFKKETDREKKRREAREEAQKKAGYDPTTSNPRNGPLFKMAEDLDLNMKLARLKVEPEKSFENLIQEIEKKPGTTGTTGLSMSKAPFAVETEKQRVLEESTLAELEARYEFLYAQMADSGIRDMKIKMDELIQTTKQTIPFMKLAEQCLTKVEAKECKNKK